MYTKSSKVLKEYNDNLRFPQKVPNVSDLYFMENPVQIRDVLYFTKKILNILYHIRNK